ncbi:MAG: hypothetical protein QM728_04875 [Gordonia sp. (in: high G+C Gram-positive bacteria)]|uniref:hypothetical protein n=1 Tax=Gordonia sp. (in: high G+C Gram-positive bacteria) TaxID=84139 RepID=UPI0039E2B621
MTDPFSQQPFPQQPYPQQPYDLGQPVVTIGDITCTSTEVITPSGTFPIAGSQWSVTDMSMTYEKISTLGIVLAVVLLWACLLSLLFLLMKDRVTTGCIQVIVRGANGEQHVTTIPATSPATMMDVSSRVNYVRTLGAAL